MADLKATWSGLDLQDRMVVGGGSGMAVLAFFPWFSMEFGDGAFGELAKSMAVQASSSVSGTGTWHGWMAVIFGAASVLWIMAPQVFAAVKDPVRAFLPVALPALGLVLGPLAFFANTPSASGMFEAGTTFWMWLALLSGAAAAGGAAWKKYGGSAPSG